MIKMGVWEAVPLKIPNHAKVISTTWAMKKKLNGTFRARVNARGFMQIGSIIILIVFLHLSLMKQPLGLSLFSLSYSGGQMNWWM